MSRAVFINNFTKPEDTSGPIHYSMKHTFQTIEIYPLFIGLSYTMFYGSILFANELHQVISTFPFSWFHCVCSFKYSLFITIYITLIKCTIIKIFCFCNYPGILIKIYIDVIPFFPSGLKCYFVRPRHPSAWSSPRSAPTGTEELQRVSWRST